MYCSPWVWLRIPCALLLLLIHIKAYRKWNKPFVIFGSNAIAAYVLSSLGAVTLELIKVGDDDVSLKTHVFTKFYLSWLEPIDASLLFAISYVLFWLAIMSVLYSKRIFIKFVSSSQCCRLRQAGAMRLKSGEFARVARPAKIFTRVRVSIDMS